ncbi:permease, partial [Streptomyces sp. NPDC047000]|uniref:permease n=1 Tax=Streptomyces sp. NPDC047000 TaxID=3155474 RepID=UPI0033C93183
MVEAAVRQAERPAPAVPAPAPARTRGLMTAVAVAVAVTAAVLLLSATGGLHHPAVLAWRTVCLAVTVQALPFLVLGTVLSGAINAFVPADLFTRVLPRRPALAVPVAGVAGVVLPGCECASVPVAGSLIGRGVT